MNDLELWKMFVKTGSINDYLNYACTFENALEEKQDNSDDSENNEVERFE